MQCALSSFLSHTLIYISQMLSLPLVLLLIVWPVLAFISDTTTRRCCRTQRFVWCHAVVAWVLSGKNKWWENEKHGKNEKTKKRKKTEKTIFILQLSHICIVDRAGFLTDCFLFISVDSSRHCRPAAFLCYCRTLGSCHLNRKSIGNRPPFGPTNGYCCRWVAHSIYTIYIPYIVYTFSYMCLFFLFAPSWNMKTRCEFSFFSIFFYFVNCDLFCLSQSFVTTHICNPVHKMAMGSPNNVIYWRFNVRESLTAKKRQWRALSALFSISLKYFNQTIGCASHRRRGCLTL